MGFAVHSKYAIMKTVINARSPPSLPLCECLVDCVLDTLLINNKKFIFKRKKKHSKIENSLMMMILIWQQKEKRKRDVFDCSLLNAVATPAGRYCRSSIKCKFEMREMRQELIYFEIIYSCRTLLMLLWFAKHRRTYSTEAKLFLFKFTLRCLCRGTVCRSVCLLLRQMIVAHSSRAHISSAVTLCATHVAVA